MQHAVTIDPNNEFAKGQYQNYLETLQKLQQQMKMQHGMGGGNPELPLTQEEMMAMLKKMEKQGVPHEKLVALQQQWMLQRIQTQEQLVATMQQLEKQGVPRADLMDFQQKWVQYQQMKHEQGMQPDQEQLLHQVRMQQQQQQQQEQIRIQQEKEEQQRRQQNQNKGPPPTPASYGVPVPKTSTTSNVPKNAPPTKDIPQNVGIPTQGQGIPPNMGLPPIEDFENGEFENMFIN